MKMISIIKLLRVVMLLSLSVSVSFLQAENNLSNQYQEMRQQQRAQSSPIETDQFGHLVGQWNIEDYQLNANGKWDKGVGANWNFYWILGGAAIQDDWISPALNKPAPSGRQYGTNIRIYNPKEKIWQMAWMSNKGGKLDTFTAKQKNNEIVMEGFFGGKNTLITFYKIQQNNFSWKMQQQNSKNQQWQEVYRIEASRAVN